MSGGGVPPNNSDQLGESWWVCGVEKCGPSAPLVRHYWHSFLRSWTDAVKVPSENLIDVTT